MLDEFVASRGDKPELSFISPYLHAGQLSPRLVIARLAANECGTIAETFWRRLPCRERGEYAPREVPEYPNCTTRPIRTHYADQERDYDTGMLWAWRNGNTGFPLVDAGMRQLWQTGWMSQSVRMVVAAFFTEYMNFDWVHGARWFQSTLMTAGRSRDWSMLPPSIDEVSGHYIRRYCIAANHLTNKTKQQLVDKQSPK